MRMRERGFSMLELVIVVAVILVIAAIAIPNLQRSKLRANEASAVASVRTINTAQATYIIAYPSEGYADNLAKLGGTSSGDPSSDHAGLVDWILGCATQPCAKNGYKFSIDSVTGHPVSGFRVVGVPQVIGGTGTRGFCSDKLNPIKVDPNGGTNCTDGLD